MSNIMKSDNGRQPATFGSVVDQIFQNNLDRFFDDRNWGFSGITHSLASGRPLANIRTTEKAYEVELIAPGLKKEDFRLAVEGDLLTVSFEPEAQKQEQKGEDWVRTEYRKQAFTRSFAMDDSVDTAKITARYENGILYLNLPKKEHAQKATRTISVQ